MARLHKQVHHLGCRFLLSADREAPLSCKIALDRLRSGGPVILDADKERPLLALFRSTPVILSLFPELLPVGAQAWALQRQNRLEGCCLCCLRVDMVLVGACSHHKVIHVI
jgi:hypothetical protein